MTPRDRRNRQFKIRLNHDEADTLRRTAYKNELSQADYVRFMIFGRTAFTLPNSSKLEAIARQLSGIGVNINQCQHMINEARGNGTLSPAQFQAMYNAITEARRLWLKPLDELKAELGKLKPKARK